jgi:hypothetical protein
VAVGIVDQLEVVEIEHDDAQRFALAAGAIDLVREEFEDGRAVPTLGQGIAGGLLAQRLAHLNQLGLQVDDAAAGAQAHFHFGVVEGLDEVVVGAGAHALDQVPALGLGGEQKDVGIGGPFAGADAAAQLGAGELGHDPIEDRERRRILTAEDIQSLLAIRRRDDFVTPFLQSGLEQTPHGGTVVRDEYLHLTVGAALVSRRLRYIILQPSPDEAQFRRAAGNDPRHGGEFSASLALKN